MNLSQIEVIVEIARAGSISKAAQNLYISQPGVSKILQKFEEEVGVQIFERGSTGVRLTPIGRRFVDNAQDVIDQAGKLEELFGSKSTSLTMELSVAAMSYHFMQRLLPEIYHKYCQNSFADTMRSIILFHILRLLFSGEPFDQPLRSADHKER